jgi:signal transduction histidine kinase
MNLGKTEWNRRYQTALRRCLEQGGSANTQQAHGLGLQAATIGLVTLDLAGIHERALAHILTPNLASMTKRRLINKAKSFFAETIVPLEKTHQAAMKAGVRVNELTQALRRRVMESSASTRSLKRSIIKRKGAEKLLKKSGKHHARLLTESSRLQKHLRRLSREILLAHEAERHRTSHRINDEIAQSLIAIDFQLLLLKKAAGDSTENLKKEIAGTQRLMRHFAKKVKEVRASGL